MRDSFTVQDAARILEISERNIRFWVTSGNIVKAAVDPGRRRSPKELSFLNLVELAVTKILAKEGFGLGVIRQAVAVIPRSRISGAFGPEPKGWLVLVFEDQARSWKAIIVKEETTVRPVPSAAMQRAQEKLGADIADSAVKAKVTFVVNITNIVRSLEQSG